MNEQMGHHSMQVTVDTFAHLTPGADVSCVDTSIRRRKIPQALVFDENAMLSQVIDLIGGPGGIRTPDQGIMSPGPAFFNPVFSFAYNNFCYA